VRHPSRAFCFAPSFACEERRVAGRVNIVRPLGSGELKQESLALQKPRSKSDFMAGNLEPKLCHEFFFEEFPRITV
jgi:hypothetical protein